MLHSLNSNILYQIYSIQSCTMVTMLLYLNSFSSPCSRLNFQLGTLSCYLYYFLRFFSLAVKSMPHHNKVESAYGVTPSVTPNRASPLISDNQTPLPSISHSHLTSVGSLALQSTATGSYKQQHASMALLQPPITITATIAQPTLPTRIQILD